MDCDSSIDRAPLAVPMASCGPEVDHRRSESSSLSPVSSDDSVFWLASHSLITGDFSCITANISPSLSHSSPVHLPLPSSGISAYSSPCLLKTLTMRFAPQVARNEPCARKGPRSDWCALHGSQPSLLLRQRTCGCHASTTGPRPWLFGGTVNSFFCARTTRWDWSAQWLRLGWREAVGVAP